VLLLLLNLLAAEPQFEKQQIFAPEALHNHSSSIVELPNGDLYCVWFHGSGERTADDVVVMGSRWRKSRRVWTKPEIVADEPGFPDTNPVLYLDSKKRLWLFWAQIIANEWHTALTRYKVSSNYWDDTAQPKWDWSGNVTVIPQNIAAKTKLAFPDSERQNRLAGDKYFSRMGWFTRTHPIELPSGRMLLPMYSDGYSYGLMALSDDGGHTWRGSEPLVCAGCIQPSVVRKKDGTLVAFMRDNGPAPKRIHRSESKDNGETWSLGADTDQPNPGASVEAIVLKSGEWLLVSNDTEKDRNRLRVALSDDEGVTWKWSRYVENAPAGRYHYPSAIQGSGGAIHLTYSHHTDKGKTIVHAKFDVEWIKASGEK
jgi:predicted neuraminidase